MGWQVNELLAFLEARIAEDEKGNQPDTDPESWCDRIAGTHYDHARVSGEIAAKRAIIKTYHSCRDAEIMTTEFGPKLVTSGMVKGLEVALKCLANPYATHPDYRKEWAS